jgi:hypothetical protein
MIKATPFVSALLAILLLCTSVASAASPNCAVRIPQNQHLEVRDGFARFIDANAIQPFLDSLPQVTDQKIHDILHSPDTMWYDEESMIFTYQDSVESVVGLRANCVGRDVGERNRDNPGIAILMNIFGEDYKFLFPFRGVAGTDRVTNLKSLNFWLPPKDAQGKVMPVRWWKTSSRGRWLWVFPDRTIFGELLFQKSPRGEWIPFELRTRVRYLDGWVPNVFRPYASASELSATVKSLRPEWASSASLTRWITAVEDSHTLKPIELKSTAFAATFPPIKGAIDPIPALNDPDLIEELLKAKPFKSMSGKIWKENSQLETYAPGSQEDFSIVPKNYEMGAIAVNEVSCTRCHNDTGRPVKDAEFRAILYGEVWGEDRIFTWHPFKVTPRIFGTFDDGDYPPSRELNPRLISAKLLQQGAPAANDPNYRTLPIPYVRP